MTLSHLKPTVPKCWLFAASGVMWSAVGIMMCATGIGWLAAGGLVRGMGFELAGLILAMLFFRWWFGSLAQKNIRRLRRLPDRGCFFAFQAWKSYLIIMVMIALGIYPAALIDPETCPGRGLHSHRRRPDSGQHFTTIGTMA